MKLFLPDTHAVYWYEIGDGKLSNVAAAAFREAEAGNALLISHSVVLAEFYWLLKKPKLETRYLPYLNFVSSNPLYRYESVAAEDLQQLDHFSEVPEMHDRLIAIAARRVGATIITRDPALQASPNVKWIW